MRRLVIVSVLLIVAGLALLLPSSALYSLLTKGTASSSATPSRATEFFISSASSGASSASNTGTIESLLGFGLIAVGAVVELFSLITDVPGAVSTAAAAAAEPEVTPPEANPTPAAQPATTMGEKKQ